MDLPAYYLPQPPADWGTPTLESFERLYAQAALGPGGGGAIEYALPAPKWQFLCWLCDQKNIVVHGSGQPDIDEFEPRQSNDVLEFGNRRAVYAASDGLWAMYFAIVDRDRYHLSLCNACFRVVEADGTRHGPYYFFSVSGDALPHRPWRAGTIYLLPGATFERQPALRSQGAVIETAQWASRVPVRPLARLAVGPEDFPLLDQIRPHDPARLRERAQADPDGFPWLDA